MSQLFSCPICHCILLRVESVLEHIKMFHKDSPLNSPTKALDQQTSKLSLDKPMDDETTPHKYDCSACHFKTPKRLEMAAHLIEKHNAGRNVFLCNLCDFSGPKRGKLVAHIADVHFPVGQGQDSVQPLESSIERHLNDIRCMLGEITMLLNRPKKKDTSSEGSLEYNCTICNFKATQRLGMACHLLDKHTLGRGIFLCNFDKCDFLASKWDQLVNHTSDAHIPTVEMVQPQSAPAQQNSRSKKGVEKGTDAALLLRTAGEAKVGKKKKQKSPSIDDGTVCQHCAFITSSRQSFIAHLKKKHNISV